MEDAQVFENQSPGKESLSYRHRNKNSNEEQESEHRDGRPEGNWTETTLFVPHKKASEELEFGGVRGAAMTVVLMPLTVFLINAACSRTRCTVLQWPKLPVDWPALFDWTAMLVYLGWLFLQVCLYVWLPGHIVLGQPLKSGHRLPYKCNGFRSLVVSLLLFLLALYLGVPVTYVYDHMFSLITMATISSFALSVFLYMKAQFAEPSQFSAHGNTGIGIYDFHLGHELNPRIGSFDLKFFCELRPGLIGWLMMDLVYIVRDWELDGEVSASLVLVVIFQAMYVADALYFEPTVLTTLDLTTEGFGFMLAFGDLTWVPFVFSLQARFLLEHPQNWSAFMLVAFFLLNSLGYWVFRASNSQKDVFRSNPNHSSVKDLTTVEGTGGKRLLAAGWWGMCRHPNYLGDLMMGFAWCLPCGFGHVLPWYYMLYLSGALVHRSGRDDKLCHTKYGSLWKLYCNKVPNKIIPYIY